MDSTQTKLITVFAPAKVNLYLHVTGRLDNGYHTLDSLIAFADIGDAVDIEPSPDFEFRVNGPYAKIFNPKETDASPNSSNLVVQATWALAQAAQKTPNVRITLKKNLPLAAGLGGGSADAAAALWGLCEWWGIPRTAHYLPGLMARLGADIPVCLNCRAARVCGIGDIIDPAPAMSETPVVLVNPGVHCPTPEVFSLFSGAFRQPQSLPQNLESFADLVRFLQANHNDLQDAARKIAPGISAALKILGAQKECAFAAMSGSGATCFGIFEKESEAKKAARAIAQKHPGWWVKPGWLNRPERY